MTYPSPPNSLLILYPKEYEAWVSMRKRCRNPKHIKYKYYGGRGITICSRWNKFACFLADLGPKPTSNKSGRKEGGFELDRIDVNGNYEPTNCRWSIHNSGDRRSKTEVKLQQEVSA